ncbi:hypothetical protein PISMIDRAFT_688076, partial [Pisolithus microcarpus 441]
MVKFYSDPLVSDKWPRPEREWKDKEFAVVARCIAPTRGLKYEEIARWAPALSAGKWNHSVYSYGAGDPYAIGVEEKAGDL